MPEGGAVQANGLCPLLFLLEDFFWVLDGSSFEECDVQQGQSNANEQVKPILVKNHAKSSDIHQRYCEYLQRRFDQPMTIVKDQLSQQMHPNGTRPRNQADTLTHNPIMRKIYNNPHDLQVDTAEVELEEGYRRCCFFLLGKEVELR